MKKLLLMAAFAGMLANTTVANTFGDDKGKGKDKDKKECCKKGEGEKSCAGEKKEGCSKGEKSCCKKGEKASEKKS